MARGSRKGGASKGFLRALQDARQVERDNTLTNAARGRDACGVNHDELAGSSDTVVALREKVAELERALRPFAVVGETFLEHSPAPGTVSLADMALWRRSSNVRDEVLLTAADCVLAAKVLRGR